MPLLKRLNNSAQPEPVIARIAATFIKGHKRTPFHFAQAMGKKRQTGLSQVLLQGYSFNFFGNKEVQYGSSS
jgi:hypothetical protein